MTTTHTPGPWRVHPYRNHTIGRFNKAIDVGPYGLAVTTVIGAFEKSEAGPEAEASARLISAAPDMLAALKAVIASPRPACESDAADWNERYRAYEAALNAAQTAIAIAEGR